MATLRFGLVIHWLCFLISLPSLIDQLIISYEQLYEWYVLRDVVVVEEYSILGVSNSNKYLIRALFINIIGILVRYITSGKIYLLPFLSPIEIGNKSKD